LIIEEIELDFIDEHELISDKDKSIMVNENDDKYQSPPMSNKDSDLLLS
jgi:pyridoxal biosynthesis lyase PdxS